MELSEVVNMQNGKKKNHKWNNLMSGQDSDQEVQIVNKHEIMFSKPGLQRHTNYDWDPISP